MKSIMTAVLLTAENRLRLSAKGAVMRPVLLLVFVLLSTGVNAQWLNFRTPGTPRSRDGTPNLNAPTPRADDGKPDLGGVWMHELTSTAEMKRLFGPVIDEAAKVEVPGMEIGTLHKYGFSILLDFKPGEAPMRQNAVDIMQLASQRNPPDVCTTPAGIPLVSFLSEPIKIIQSPRLAVILHEDNTHRQIYTDGRVLPKQFDFPAYRGYSVGRWEGETLVVETAGFNDKTELDFIGHPHSEALRVVERFRRRDFGHLEVDMTFDDPQMYTNIIAIKVVFDLLADSDIFENFCHENEKDRVHLEQK